MNRNENTMEEFKIWLFDLAHGNLSEQEIARGFVEYYVLEGFVEGNVIQDIHFRTTYGLEGEHRAKEDLRRVLRKFAAGETLDRKKPLPV